MPKKRLLAGVFARKTRNGTFWNIVFLLIGLEIIFLLLKNPSGPNTKYIKNSDPNELDEYGGNYFGHVLSKFEPPSWVKDKWIIAKKWWYKKVILKEYELPQFEDSESEVGHKVTGSKDEQANPDFLYNYPTQDKFAYIWYAITPAQFCSALISMKRIKALRYTSFGLPNQMAPQVDFILVFAGDGPTVSPDKFDSDEDVLLNDPLIERLVDKWTQEGGLIGGYNIPVDHASRTNYITLARELKFSCFTFDYSWVIILEPDGVPLKHMDELFNMYNQSALRSHNVNSATGQTLISAPKAHAKEKQLLENMTSKLKCSDHAETVTTAVISVQPLKFLYERLKFVNSNAKTWKKMPGEESPLYLLSQLVLNFPDIVLLNKELSCNDELLVLPSHYSIHDFEFFKKKISDRVPKLEESQYIHFSFPIKPWQHEYQQRILPYLTEDGKKFVINWLEDGEEICDFHNAADWEPRGQHVEPSVDDSIEDSEELDKVLHKFDRDYKERQVIVDNGLQSYQNNKEGVGEANGQLFDSLSELNRHLIEHAIQINPPAELEVVEQQVSNIGKKKGGQLYTKRHQILPKKANQPAKSARSNPAQFKRGKKKMKKNQN